MLVINGLSGFLSIGQGGEKKKKAVLGSGPVSQVPCTVACDLPALLLFVPSRKREARGGCVTSGSSIAAQPAAN